ncbi:MAG: hypothetical protein ACOC2L_02465, partial [Candidatus Sumerlaeota bacterium]
TAGSWQRLRGMTPRQEPGAVIPHAEICAGAPGNRHPYRNHICFQSVIGFGFFPFPLKLPCSNKPGYGTVENSPPALY